MPPQLGGNGAAVQFEATRRIWGGGGWLLPAGLRGSENGQSSAIEQVQPTKISHLTSRVPSACLSVGGGHAGKLPPELLWLQRLALATRGGRQSAAMACACASRSGGKKGGGGGARGGQAEVVIQQRAAVKYDRWVRRGT